MNVACRAQSIRQRDEIDPSCRPWTELNRIPTAKARRKVRCVGVERVVTAKPARGTLS